MFKYLRALLARGLLAVVGLVAIRIVYSMDFSGVTGSSSVDHSDVGGNCDVDRPISTGAPTSVSHEQSSTNIRQRAPGMPHGGPSRQLDQSKLVAVQTNCSSIIDGEKKMNNLPLPESLESLQRETFDYFIHEVNSENGLVMDRTAEASPTSIAGVGLILSAYPVGVERGFITRAEAVKRTLTTLRFFKNSPQSTDAQSAGYKGFYYHFLDMKTGLRVWECELSTVDSAFLFAGMLTAAAYFTQETIEESEIRSLADELYRRADWKWALNGGATITHGWKPESGFMPYRWEGYDEALILYLLGLGSPTHPLPEESYTAWSSTYQWKKVYDQEYLYAGPLFIHQLSHVWVDFRGIQDAWMRDKQMDYFENSRRATYVHQQYAIRNPGQFAGYGEHCWGLTACNGPGPASRTINNRDYQFFDYVARGAPDGPDDGTIAPWAVAASLPFAPEIVLPTLKHFDDLDLRAGNQYGYRSTFNATFVEPKDEPGIWVSPWHVCINHGPIVLMIENYRSEMLWRLMRQCPYLVRGLSRAGFSGGWLESVNVGQNGDQPNKL